MRSKRVRKPKPSSLIAEQPQTVYPSLAAAAAGLGIDARLLKRAKEPVPQDLRRIPGPAAGSSRLARQNVRHRKDSKLNLGEKESIDMETARIRRDREAWKFKQAQQEFIKASDAERWSQEMTAEFVKVLDSIPSTLAPDVAGLGIADAELRIRAALEQAKATLRTWCSKQ
jgi:hypothetical protein